MSAPPGDRPRTELVLIRHGVTAWNRARRFQGQIDVPLDEMGQSQAARTGRRLADWPLGAVYSSDLMRARHYGSFEGRTHDELERDEADAWRRWRARELDYTLPGGGESLRALHARVASVLRELASRHPGQTVVAVTHGGVLDIAYRLATGLPLEAPRSHDLLNASLNRVAWDGAPSA